MAKNSDKNNPPAKKSAKDKVKDAAGKAEAATAKKKAAETAVAEKATAKAAKAAEKTATKVKKIDFNSPMNEDEQKLFNQHLPSLVAQIDKVSTAVADLRNLYKKAKGDGFEKADFDIARAIETAEGEAKEKAKIARKLTISKYRGKALGSQLDMFLMPDRTTPSSEIAYEEGKIAAQSNQAAKPGYDPSTEQHREYMRGYHEVQEKQIKAGITKPEPAPAEAPTPAPTVLIPKAEKEAKEAAKQAPAPSVPKAAPVPHSGMGMSRADYLAQKNKAKEEAEKLFKPSTEIDDYSAEKPEPEFQSAFKKKAVPA